MVGISFFGISLSGSFHGVSKTMADRWVTDLCHVVDRTARWKPDAT